MPQRIGPGNDLDMRPWRPGNYAVAGAVLLVVAALLAAGGASTGIAALLGFVGLALVLIGVIGKGVQVGTRRDD